MTLSVPAGWTLVTAATQQEVASGMLPAMAYGKAVLHLKGVAGPIRLPDRLGFIGVECSCGKVGLVRLDGKRYVADTPGWTFTPSTPDSKHDDAKLWNCGEPGHYQAGVGYVKVGWLIVEGGSDPLHPDWLRELRDQCQAAGVPFCFLGWGDWYIRTSVPAERCLVGIRWEEGMPEGVANEIVMYRVGKGKSGRLLDGKVWDEQPEGVKS